MTCNRLHFNRVFYGCVMHLFLTIEDLWLESIVSGINRIYGNEHGNVPSSTRIVQDCRKAIRPFHAVYMHGGGMVPGLANRNGHRNYTVGRNTSGWGGLRIKNLSFEETGR